MALVARTQPFNNFNNRRRASAPHCLKKARLVNAESVTFQQSVSQHLTNGSIPFPSTFRKELKCI